MVRHATHTDAAKSALCCEESPLFFADWREALFIHYQLDADALQRHVPFELDLYEGRAYVSLVAFTQSRLRPGLGGRLAEVLSAPLARHSFLNVRTYVRHGNDRGIYFIAEWIPNVLAFWIGPRLYGLPYRLGTVQYAFDPCCGEMRGRVCAAGELWFDARFDPQSPITSAGPGSRDEFLIERYCAFTWHRGIARQFRIWHEPWPQAPVRQIKIERCDLLARFPWMKNATPAGAHFSPGVSGVRIGRPQRVSLVSNERRLICSAQLSGVI